MSVKQLKNVDIYIKKMYDNCIHKERRMDV